MVTYIKTSLLLLIVLTWPQQSWASDMSQYLGIWQTIDDETNKPKSLIRLSIKNKQLQAHIIKTFPRSGENEKLAKTESKNTEPRCTQCKGELKNSKIIGLNIFSNMHFNGELWDSGQILDPNNGKKYDAKVWFEEGTLRVRGYIGFFYRTQTWLRFNDENLKNK